MKRLNNEAKDNINEIRYEITDTNLNFQKVAEDATDNKKYFAENTKTIRK
jgi:hypothetical protein